MSVKQAQHPPLNSDARVRLTANAAIGTETTGKGTSAP
jgi:hypothetical protein